MAVHTVSSGGGVSHRPYSVDVVNFFSLAPCWENFTQATTSKNDHGASLRSLMSDGVRTEQVRSSAVTCGTPPPSPHLSPSLSLSCPSEQQSARSMQIIHWRPLNELAHSARSVHQSVKCQQRRSAVTRTAGLLWPTDSSSHRNKEPPGVALFEYDIIIMCSSI